MLKYLYDSIYISEIPDEISLGFIITGCNIQCPECHSKHIWNKDIGYELTENAIKNKIQKQKHISCLLFFGGEDRFELYEICERLYKETNNIKLALYSGMGIEYFTNKHNEWLSVLDYLKVGPYIEELGGLAIPTTNQRLYKIENNNLIDITSKFWKLNKGE